MKHLLPPDAWRSEAFAEDLFTDSRDRQPSPGPQFGAMNSTLIGLLPLALAAVGVFWVVSRV